MFIDSFLGCKNKSMLLFFRRYFIFFLHRHVDVFRSLRYVTSRPLVSILILVSLFEEIMISFEYIILLIVNY